MSSQPSIFSRPAARKIIISLMIIMSAFIATSYGLLWLYAKHQQRLLGNAYLADMIADLNYKIEHHQSDLKNEQFIKPDTVHAYYVIVFEPTGNTISILSDTDNAKAILPSWSLAQSDSNKIFYDYNSLEAWQSLHQGYRVYIKIKFNSLWQSFVNPIYLLPLLLFFSIILLAIITLKKRYIAWAHLVDYLQAFQGNIAQGYQPLALSYYQQDPELHHLVQLLNRFSFKVSQYFTKVNELTYRQTTLIDKSPVLLFLLNRKGRLLYFNEKFAQSFNTPFNADVVYMLSDFITGTNKSAQQFLTNISEVHTYITLSVTNLQRDIYFELRINPIYNRFGQLQGYSGGLEEVTQYYDKLQQAWVEDQQTSGTIASFNKMWAVLGHELRTPLSGIVGMIDLLADDTNQLNTEQKETIATLQQSSQTMVQLLNDMLDVAKLEAGKLQTNITSMDLLKTLRQTAELMVANARRQKISLYIFIDPNVPRYIECDEGRLRQIILNLMSNAIKFTQQGYVAIIVERTDDHHPLIQHKKSTAQPSITDWLKITVKDTGLGIHEKDQQKLFSYFNQANESISRQFGGTGLGLAISNNFSQLLGGFIHLDSKYHQGSEFQLFLPMPKFSIQPIYQFKTHNLSVFLILISPFAIINRLDKVLSYLGLPHQIFIHHDHSIVEAINNLDTKGLTPVFIVDDDIVINHQQLLHDIKRFNEAIKILVSIESPKTLPTALLLEYDGYLQKPVSITNMIAEVNHLYEQTTQLSKPSANLPAQLAFAQFLQQHPELNPELGVSAPTATAQPMLTSDLPNQSATVALPTATTPTTATPSHSSTHVHHKMILVAEDNPVNQLIAKKHLTALGYDYLIADDGEQAVTLLQQFRSQIGLVLMDCRMPILDGMEATRLIRLNKDSIPIIALTANDTDEDKRRCIDAGMDSFLAKPLNKQKLLEVINRYML